MYKIPEYLSIDWICLSWEWHRLQVSCVETHVIAPQVSEAVGSSQLLTYQAWTPSVQISGISADKCRSPSTACGEAPCLFRWTVLCSSSYCSHNRPLSPYQYRWFSIGSWLGLERMYLFHCRLVCMCCSGGYPYVSNNDWIPIPLWVFAILVQAVFFVSWLHVDICVEFFGPLDMRMSMNGISLTLLFFIVNSNLNVA